MKSKYSISKDIQEFGSDFQRVTKEGFDLIDVKYANGIWFGAYGKNIGLSEYLVSDTAWNFEPTLDGFQAKIEEREEDGYDLTDIEYTSDGYWFGVFATNLGDSELIVAEDGEDFDRQLLDLEDLESNLAVDSISEHQVFDLELADGLWAGVAKDTFRDTTYTSSEDFEEFELEVQQQESEGLKLSNVEYLDGDWYGVFDRDISGLSIYSPEPHEDLDDFTDEIETFRGEGFDLINIESIDGDWFGIYQENTDATDDIITPSDEAANADPIQTSIDRIILPTLREEILRYNLSQKLNSNKKMD